jgi:hypothetical protein
MTYDGPVRIADDRFEEDIVKLIHDLHGEVGLFKLDDDRVRTMLRRAFDREGGIIGVLNNGDAIEGIIYLLVSNFWYSNDAYLEEIFLYVPQKYRKTKNAIELMKFAKWCATQSGFPLLIGVLNNERTAGKVRLYQRQFETPAGNFFIYNGKKKAA